MTTIDMLREMADDWLVTIESPTTVVVVSKRRGTSHRYERATLDLAISSAWAGEPPQEHS
jgi:hypothetical protein